MMHLQKHFWPVCLKDVQWMMKQSVRHWLQVASDFEVKDYKAERMRQIARDQRDEVRQAWGAHKVGGLDLDTLTSEADLGDWPGGVLSFLELFESDLEAPCRRVELRNDTTLAVQLGAGLETGGGRERGDAGSKAGAQQRAGA